MTARLAHLAEVTFGLPFASERFNADPSTGRRVIRIRDLSGDEDPIYTDEPAPEEAVVVPGDVLVGMDGDFRVHVWRGGEALLNQRVARLRARPGNDVRFLGYSIARPLRLVADLKHATTVKHLSAADLKKLPVPQRSAAAQRVVADFLDRECAHIEELLKAIEAAASLAAAEAASRIEAMVWPPSEGGQALDDMPALGALPTSWLRARNKVLYREAVDLSTDGSEELLSVSHIHGVTSRAESQANMFMAESHVGYKRVRPGDLVMNTMWVWMGALGVSRLEGIVSPAYGVFRGVDDRLLPEYADLLYRTSGYVAEMTRRSSGVWSSRLRLYADSFLAMPVAVPAVEHQREVVIAASASRSWAQRVGQRYAVLGERLREYRESLVAEATAGTLDVADFKRSCMEERARAAMEGATA